MRWLLQRKPHEKQRERHLETLLAMAGPRVWCGARLRACCTVGLPFHCTAGGVRGVAVGGWVGSQHHCSAARVRVQRTPAALQLRLHPHAWHVHVRVRAGACGRCCVHAVACVGAFASHPLPTLNPPLCCRRVRGAVHGCVRMDRTTPLQAWLGPACVAVPCGAAAQPWPVHAYRVFRGSGPFLQPHNIFTSFSGLI